MKDNCSISGVPQIMEEMLVKYAISVEAVKQAKLENLKDIKVLPSYEIVELELLFEKNLQIYYDAEGKELFAFYKFYGLNYIYNIIFPTYKKYNWQDHFYALPTSGPGDSGKRLKGHTVKLIVETREPYADRKGTKLVQNLLVKSFVTI